MEWDIKLRRTQSLKSLPTQCDKPSWATMGLRDKSISVSQLVARYQTTVKVSTTIRETSVSHDEGTPVQALEENASPPAERTQTHLDTLLRNNEERERSRARGGLSHARSMDSLHSSRTGSIVALKAKFEGNAATASKEKSRFGAANVASPNKSDVPVMNGEVEKPKRAAAEQAAVITVQNIEKVQVKHDHAPQKAASVKKVERRKTIAGIDFEKVAASEADEKRRSIADFRDSSFIQATEKLPVSVKAMSALYLSKVAPQDSPNGLLKPEQGLSGESPKRAKPVKMAEDSTSSQRTDVLPPRAPVAQDVSAPHSHHASQVSKEMLYQQRQKCELRRLLKHTHPELKMLDDVVDEELAEVLSSEPETAGETGYEGEVFSRRLLFENSGFGDKVSPYTPKVHMAKGTGGRCDKKTSAIYEQPKERPSSEFLSGITEDDNSTGLRPDPNSECEKEMVRIDVKAAKKLFENQPENTFKPHSGSNFQSKACMVATEREAVQKPEKQIDTIKKDKAIFSDLERPQCVQSVDQNTERFSRKEDSNVQTLFEDDFMSCPDLEGHGDTIKTSAALFQNNPFVSTNIERETSFLQASNSGTDEDCLTANVKNRTHLFESMPFDQIRRQNQDDIETMVENIKETLHLLYRANVIQSFGSIIEVNETMIAKKAKFTLSQIGPVINYEEVAEGGAQNFVLHSLPRVNLKPQLTYLKEDNRGCMRATVVNVPVHQHQFNTKDLECKTANVAQIVEDILNQDNSLRKGVIIQENVKSSAKVIVYSLYNYFDEEDVKSYSPEQGAEYDEPELEIVDRVKTQKGIIESAKSSLLETVDDHTSAGSVQHEVAAKGNVKLFRSCIEKGDFEHLRSLRTEATVEEVDTEAMNHEQKSETPEESDWVPVDIKRLKSIFSGDSSPVQPKTSHYCHVSTGQNVSGSNSVASAEQEPKVVRQTDLVDDRVHQAELVHVINDDEISDLRTAIHDLQQATVKAKKLQLLPVKPSDEYFVTCENQKLDAEPKAEFSSVPSEDKGNFQSKSIDTCWEVQTDVSSKYHKSTEVLQNHLFQAASIDASENAPSQEDEEVDFQGKFQAALNSLERSNINVTKGDFRAAMIYRNSSKSQQEKSQTVVRANPPTPCDESESQLSREVKEETSRENKTLSDPTSEKKKKPLGPKPALPPKPEHLTMQQKAVDKNVQGTQNINKETFPQAKKGTVSCKDEQFKSNSDPVEHRGTEQRSQQVQCSTVLSENTKSDTNISAEQAIINAPVNGKGHHESPAKDITNEAEEKHVDFHEARQKFSGKKSTSKKVPPVKPKRVKIAQEPTDASGGQKGESQEKQESRVEMREKKGRAETEDERRRRLSVHMDEIMRGNTTAAMEIFDNLRKQEELQSLLSRVEEIEQDTSEVDVSSLKNVFENVPDWIVSSDKKKNRKKKERKESKLPLLKENTQKPSMALVFGDLERASEEIMCLKEQTVARLVDIEEAIKKALYSVSTLKSETDIAGLSCLFKESLGTVQESASSGNISKISIESSKTKSQQAKESDAMQGESGKVQAGSPKQQSSPPSSPAFISIQSAARKNSKTEAGSSETTLCHSCQQNPKAEEKFRTTKTLTCNSPAQNRKKDHRKRGQKQNAGSKPPREVSVLEVHTDPEGKSIVGTKIVKENYERTDNFGNRFYSSKTSTVVTNQPENTSSTETATSPTTYQVTTYPEVQLPVNQMPK